MLRLCLILAIKVFVLSYLTLASESVVCVIVAFERLSGRSAFPARLMIGSPRGGGRASERASVFNQSDMNRHALVCFLLPVLLWASGACGGPLSGPRPNMTDQELFWGADQYDFSVLLPAAGTDCFWHFAHHGEKFYLSFMVQWVTGVGHDRHLSVTVNAPDGLLLSTVDDANGQVELDARETGFYQMCFSNFHNLLGSMQVSLSFGVYYERTPQKLQQDHNAGELNGTLSIIEAWSRRVENAAFHMFRHYNAGRLRRGADHFLLASKQRRVGFCSAALALLVVLAGYLQLRFLKSLFAPRQDGEPRAC
ncbi:transmembrane emp24 domain-containing protein 6 [Vanacampus margaritifer]